VPDRPVIRVSNIYQRIGQTRAHVTLASHGTGALHLLAAVADPYLTGAEVVLSRKRSLPVIGISGQGRTP
jgi:hypothetical protein